MPEPPDYDAIERKMWRENAGAVFLRLREKDANILKRIRTFLWRFGFSKEEVQDKIEKDTMFAAHFAKEPRRTGLHEKAAAEWLRNLASVSHFTVLPKRKPRAFYITSDGEIREGMENPPSKSLDFYWRTGKTEFYASHKYTREGGGNQDSQFKEMKDLLRNFQRAATKNKVLIIIVDGPYYTDVKMEDLSRFVRDRSPRSHACHIENVPGVLAEYV